MSSLLAGEQLAAPCWATLMPSLTSAGVLAAPDWTRCSAFSDSPTPPAHDSMSAVTCWR
jgi:hypothetical protein